VVRRTPAPTPTPTTVARIDLPPTTVPAPITVPTAPPSIVAPPPTPAATSPPSPAGPAPWNSEAAVRRALQSYVAAFASLDVNAIKAVYPSIPKQDLERLRYFKAYDMDIEPVSIQINGQRARVRSQLKAALKSFTGKEHVLAPHEEEFVLEYRGGSWVRVQ
jgi:hypothetical protein